MPNTNLTCGLYPVSSSVIRSLRARTYASINPPDAYILRIMSNLTNPDSSIPNQKPPYPQALINPHQHMLLLPLSLSVQRHSYTLRRLHPRARILTRNSRLPQRRPLHHCRKVILRWVQELVQLTRHLLVLYRRTQNRFPTPSLLSRFQPHHHNNHNSQVLPLLNLHQTPIL